LRALAKVAILAVFLFFLAMAVKVALPQSPVDTMGIYFIGRRIIATSAHVDKVPQSLRHPLLLLLPKTFNFIFPKKKNPWRLMAIDNFPLFYRLPRPDASGISVGTPCPRPRISRIP
jgi:hypothetical protein